MSARVLVVEDNPDLLMTIAFVLEADGCEVDQALNGLEACRLLAKRSRAPDLIVLDMQMPVMDGWRFAEALAGMDLPGADDVPVLVVTASDHSPPWAAGVLRKPFEVAPLLDEARRLLGQARSIRPRRRRSRGESTADHGPGPTAG